MVFRSARLTALFSCSLDSDPFLASLSSSFVSLDAKVGWDLLQNCSKALDVVQSFLQKRLPVVVVGLQHRESVC